MMTGIGAAILRMNACEPIDISRSNHFAADKAANDIATSRFETQIRGTIKHLGMVEINEVSGKRSRDTIRVRSDEPIYQAVPQENAEEDIVHYDGSLWRVISVRKNASTWVATAVRTIGKKEFCTNDADRNVKPSGIHIIR